MTASNTQVGGDHYAKMGEFQPWDVLQHWLTPEEYRGYQKGVIIAYLARERAKGGDQDIRKAAHHLQKLCEVLDAKSDDVSSLTLDSGERMSFDDPATQPEIEWIEWKGGKIPVSGEVLVEVQHRSGLKWERIPAINHRWSHNDSGSDIIKYAVVK